MDISIQICSYNRKNVLEKCLRALCNLNYDRDKFELVLVDDGSVDGTGELVKNLNMPIKHKYIYQENQGLATARNKGIRAAEGKYILFIDDDIIADKELLNEHIKFHEKYMRSVVKGWVNHVDDLDNITKPKFTWADFSTAFFWTSNVSVERKFLLQSGLFDEEFREYGWEDLELGLRLRKLGLSSRFNKDAVVYHYKGMWNKERLERSIKVSQAKGRTAVLFCKKHPGARVKIATGNYFLRKFLNTVLYCAGSGEKLCNGLLEKRNSGKYTSFDIFLAKRLIDFEYFRAMSGEEKK
ncbi:MAG: glycosyltransferase family 2 protein [Armatimonadota bacterium]